MNIIKQLAKEWEEYKGEIDDYNQEQIRAGYDGLSQEEYYKKHNRFPPSWNFMFQTKSFESFMIYLSNKYNK